MAKIQLFPRAAAGYPSVPDRSGWPEKPKWEAEHILPDRAGTQTPAGRLSFADVAEGKTGLDDFLADLTDDELITLLGGAPNRKGSDSRVSERALREIYLRGFEIVVKESGVWAVMTAYNLLNGIYTSENKDLISGILREEWGFDGLVVTDWENYAEHYAEAIAGNNVRMPHGSPRRLQRAMQEGLITREDLLPNVRRVLQFLLRLA